MASKGLEAENTIYDNIIHTSTLIWTDLQCSQGHHLGFCQKPFAAS